MDTARLRELVDKLIEVDSREGVSATLSLAAESMMAIVNSPGQSDPQIQYATRLTDLRGKVAAMIASFTPAEIELLADIRATPFFAVNFAEEVELAGQRNGVTPSVVSGLLQDLTSHRAIYMKQLRVLKQALENVGITPPSVEPGSAELGILLPRQLFRNELDGLVSELKTLNAVFRTFSEIVTGEVEKVEIRQISTSDPLFGFAMGVETIVQLGVAVTWALHTWKNVEEIRKLRTQVKANPLFKDEEIKQFFNDKIDAQIEKSVREKVSELVPAATTTPGRPHELAVQAEWALRTILTRVERGMTVEIRFLAPPTSEEDGAQESAARQPFETMEKLASQLKFPGAQSDPVLQLPPPEPPAANENGLKPPDTKP